MLEKLHNSIFPARPNKPKSSMYQCAEQSRAVLASALYEERALAKIKDLRRARMDGVRNQSGRAKARTKQEISNKQNE